MRHLLYILPLISYRYRRIAQLANNWEGYPNLPPEIRQSDHSFCWQALIFVWVAMLKHY